MGILRRTLDESSPFYIKWVPRGIWRHTRRNGQRSITGHAMTSNLRNALLIHNPNAGNGGAGRRQMLDQARRILSSGGIEAELIETRGPGDATQMAQQATADGRQL